MLPCTLFGENEQPAMKTSSRVRLMGSTLGVLTVAIIVAAVLWNRTPKNTAGPVIVSAGAGAAAAKSPATDAPRKPPDFSHLPPAERINAETKQRMEQNAAWREKLRSGDYSTLPPEAWPPGVTPSGTATPQ